MPSEKNGRKGNAEVAELADAHGSGPCGSNTMRVQVPPPALTKKPVSRREQVFCILDRVDLYTKTSSEDPLGAEKGPAGGG